MKRVHADTKRLNMSPWHAAGPQRVEAAILLLLGIGASSQSHGRHQGNQQGRVRLAPAGGELSQREKLRLSREPPRKRGEATREPRLPPSEPLGLPVARRSQKPWVRESAGDQPGPTAGGGVT